MDTPNLRPVVTGRLPGTIRATCPEHSPYMAGCADCRKATARYQNITRAERERGITRRIDATGTRRRIQALAVMGYDHTAIARAFLHLFGRDLHTSNVQQWGKRTTVLRTNADQLKVVYERLCRTPGPSKKAKQLAEAQGWVGPLAWDDIDDPRDQPTTRPKPQRMPQADLIEDVEWLAQCGESWWGIAARFRVKPGTIEKALRRANRHDLMTRITANSHGVWPKGSREAA